MKERRAEPRLLCSDLITVLVEGARAGKLVGNLEDISPSGACVQFEEPLETGARVILKLGKHLFTGCVIHCTLYEGGYFVGVKFDAGKTWSRRLYQPKHLLDPAELLRRGAGNRN